MSVRIEEILGSRSLARSCFKREIAGFQFTAAEKRNEIVSRFILGEQAKPNLTS